MKPRVRESTCADPVESPLPPAHSENFGESVERRPLVVTYSGDPDATLRIFILACQHGDEPDARDAAADFLQRLGNGGFRAPARIAVVTEANPDGLAAADRRNAMGLDLNRDHLLLDAPETMALHALVDRVKPHLILDVHTYRPWRRELATDLIFPQDVMLDFPTNPAFDTPLLPTQQSAALAFVRHRLAEAGLRSERYTLIRAGPHSEIVRHSNVDIVDARNGLAVRFQTPVILIEGRRPAPEDPFPFAAPRIALLRAIEACAEWAARHAVLLTQPALAVRRQIAVQCDYRGSDEPCYLEMQSASSGIISRVRIPGRYVPQVIATKSVVLPFAYAIPRKLEGVVGVLTKHRFASKPLGRLRSRRTEQYRIESLIPAPEHDSILLPICTRRLASPNLDDFVTFPTQQPSGAMLALLLEPESQFGPHRLPELADTLRPGSAYPIIRVA